MNRNEVSEELVALLEYMETMDADKIGNDSENLKKLHEYVEQIKASEEIGVKYMQKWEEHWNTNVKMHVRKAVKRS